MYTSNVAGIEQRLCQEKFDLFCYNINAIMEPASINPSEKNVNFPNPPIANFVYVLNIFAAMFVFFYSKKLQEDTTLQKI